MKETKSISFELTQVNADTENTMSASEVYGVSGKRYNEIAEELFDYLKETGEQKEVDIYDNREFLYHGLSAYTGAEAIAAACIVMSQHGAQQVIKRLNAERELVSSILSCIGGE